MGGVWTIETPPLRQRHLLRDPYQKHQALPVVLTADLLVEYLVSCKNPLRRFGTAMVGVVNEERAVRQQVLLQYLCATGLQQVIPGKALLRNILDSAAAV